MSENLVIVESPAKAKTIEKFLGKDFLVKSSFGHVRDLPKKGLGIEVNNGFEPTYEVSDDKKQVVSELKKLAKTAKCVWLASDEDREGEAIAWHLSQVLGLDVKNTKRIVFHEITKNAILSAIESPRTVDVNLVNAQQARRILDRLVGFELSPVLWKKVKPSLSAGRVQSVAVRLVVEREHEIIDFKGSDFYRVVGIFAFTDKSDRSYQIRAELGSRFKTQEQAEAFLKVCQQSDFSVGAVEKKPGKRSPAAPFTTSTLQQEASRKLGFSVSQTMSVAQRLYEAGLITYMRTDSVNLSKEAIAKVSEVVTGNYGAEYLYHRAYKTKSKGAQEAHEAIRPSYVDKQVAGATKQEQRLYDLIWKRTVASQMADALLERTNIDIKVSKSDEKFVAKGEVIKFDGFLRLYSESVEDESVESTDSSSGALLPPLTVGEELQMQEITATQRFDQRPPRYSEASLVKHLEELGIGRPSTYAPTISTIINRGYVLKEDREGTKRSYGQLLLTDGVITAGEFTENVGAEKSKLFPTDIGMVVTDYLERHFPSILDYNFTAKVEKDFDDIAEGKVEWQQMMAHFYGPFHQTVETAEGESASSATNSARLLGTDPASGKNIYARMGKFGPMAQIGELDTEEKPQYASLQPGQLIASLTLEEALKLFSLPRTVGDYEDKTVVIGVGRFGPYVRHDSKFVSLPKGDDPLSITLERAIELVELKRKQERERVMRTFPEDAKLQLLNGRWGPYLGYDGYNIKLPKTADLESMSYEDFMVIVREQVKEGSAKPSRSRSTAKTGTKTTTSKTTTAKKKSPVKKAAAKKTTTVAKKITGKRVVKA